MQQKAGKRRWGKVVLGVSLALNLAVLGMIAGAFWRHGGADGHGPRNRGGTFAAPYVRALPAEDRHALRAALEARRPADWTRVRRAHYARVIEALRAEPFDAAAVVEALGQQRQDTLTAQQISEDAWLAQVAAMDAQTRYAYADRVEEMVSRTRGKRRWNRSH